MMNESVKKVVALAEEFEASGNTAAKSVLFALAGAMTDGKEDELYAAMSPCVRKLHAEAVALKRARARGLFYVSPN
jgi:hypothetical protein